MPEESSPLELLDQEIFSCTKCVSTVAGITHPQNPIARGKPATVMVVGIAPGKTELTAGKAFVGQAGKKLMSWLISGGVGKDETEVRARVYLTALIKCGWAKGTIPGLAISNCSQFLAKQIKLVQPGIFITLGGVPLRGIFGASDELEKYVGKSFTEEDLAGGPKLFNLLPDGCKILPFPHPSGLSRWLNDHRPLLQQAIAELKSYSPALFPEVTDES